MTESQLAHSIRKSAPTLHNYLNGLRPVPSAVLEAIGRVFYPETSQKRAEFQREIEDAQSHRATGNLLEDIKAGAPLNVTSIAEYLPVSGGHEGFFERFARRFSDLIGIPFAVRPRSVLESTDYRTNNLHMGLFDSPDRMVNLRFFRFPLRMTLGAVTDAGYLAESQTDRKALAKVMANPEHHGLIKRGVRPIVVAGEVGSIYCRKRLQFTNLSEVKTGLNVRALIEQLDTDLRIARSGGPVPVICTDEYTAFRVAGSLGAKAASIFPIASRRVAREDPVSRDLPQYYTSIAIRRVDETKSFYFFLVDALTQFLSTEVETMANWWAELAGALINIVRDSLCEGSHPARWAAAWEWVQYVMHLDKESIGSYADANRLPWQPILRRARNIVHGWWATMRDDLLVSQVAHAMENADKNKAVRTLEALFDVSITRREDDAGELSTEEVVDRLCDALNVNDMLPVMFS